MENIEYFDYYKVASEIGITQDIIIKVEKDVKKNCQMIK